MPGIYAIDPEKCDGCGECFCPYDALEIKGYARKCDLCQGNPRCTQVCLKGLSLEKTKEEKQKMAEILGWEKIQGEYTTNIEDLLPHEITILANTKEVFKELIKEKNSSLSQTLQEYLEEEHIILPKHRQEILEKTLERELKSFSILDSLLEDGQLEEITINGLDAIRVFHREKGWQKTDLKFTKTEKIIELINKIARPIGRRISLQNPRLNAVLPNGSRLHAIVPPLTKEPNMTIRKFNKQLFSPKELVKNKTISAEALAFLWMTLQSNLNILICGSTGSGKTTTLDCLATFIPKKERIIIVEEIPEVQLPHAHQVRLIVNPSLKISMSDLITDTLRMRPDRVIIGEIRTEKEVKAYMNSILAGQGKGSIATFHALDAKEALHRLELLGAKKNELKAIDLIIIQKRWTQYDKEKSTEKRRIVSITEQTNPIYKYDYSQDTIKKIQEPKLKQELEKTFKNYEKELLEREKKLQG